MLEIAEEIQPRETGLRSKPIAPWVHTAFILAVLVLWATYGALRATLPVTVVPHPVSYTTSIIVQCLMVGSTIAGLYHRREFVASVIGSVTARGLVRDLGFGFAIYIATTIVMVFVFLVTRLPGIHLTHRTDIVRSMAPRGAAELLLWLLVSGAAGIGEEFVFRGYLQRQFTGWFRSAPVAIAICSLLFGVLHLYQGTAGVAQIALLGMLYGAVAQWRGNLRGVIVAHFLQDAITGFAFYLWRP